MVIRFWNKQDKCYIDDSFEDEDILHEFALEKANKLLISITNLFKFEESDEIAIPITKLLKNEIESCFKNNNIELEFYTGLKDKNGTKIFVGDIIKRNWNGKETLHTIGFGDFTHYETGEEMMGFYLCEYDKDGSHFIEPISVAEFTPPHNVELGVSNEIIGNIHEHKHLLENLVKSS